MTCAGQLERWTCRTIPFISMGQSCRSRGKRTAAAMGAPRCIEPRRHQVRARRRFCGACTVHLDGAAWRACLTPIREVVTVRVTVIDRLRSASCELRRVWGFDRKSAPHRDHKEARLRLDAATSVGAGSTSVGAGVDLRPHALDLGPKTFDFLRSRRRPPSPDPRPSTAVALRASDPRPRTWPFSSWHWRLP